MQLFQPKISMNYTSQRWRYESDDLWFVHLFEIYYFEISIVSFFRATQKDEQVWSKKEHVL